MLTCCGGLPFPFPFQCWPRNYWTIPPRNHYKALLEGRKTKCQTACESRYNNFEILFVVFMPNITTNNAITLYKFTQFAKEKILYYQSYIIILSYKSIDMSKCHFVERYTRKNN